LLAPYRIRGSGMPQGEATGSASRKEDPSFRYTRGCREQLGPAPAKGRVIGRSARFRDGGNVQGSCPSSSAELILTPTRSPLRWASRTTASAAAIGIRFTLARKAHWSLYGRNSASTKTLFPSARGSFAEAERLSCQALPLAWCLGWGKSGHTNQSKLVTGLHSTSQDCTAEFSCGGCGDRLVEEDPHVPPFPERERSSAAGTFSSQHTARNAAASLCHVFLSKSTARNQQVSSCSSG